MKLAFTGLQQHTLGHDGGTHGLVTGGHRGDEDGDAGEEDGGEKEGAGGHDCGDLNTPC